MWELKEENKTPVLCLEKDIIQELKHIRCMFIISVFDLILKMLSDDYTVLIVTPEDGCTVYTLKTFEAVSEKLRHLSDAHNYSVFKSGKRVNITIKRNIDIIEG